MRFSALLPLSLLSLASASVVHADVVTDWNNQALSAIQATSTNPPMASRALAIVSAAVYDAVNSVDRTHQPYMVDITADPTTSREAAAIAAASTALTSLFPSQAANFTSLRNSQLALIPDSASKSAGISLGDNVGTTCFNTRTGDGSTASPPPYTGGTGIGQWRPTPPPNANGLLPAWGSVTPFSINTGSQFRPAPPPAIGSADYTTAYNEVKSLGAATGSTRTQDQTDIARAWAFGGGTITPPGGWNKVASALSVQRGLSLSENARMFAMLNVAQADAAIACWDAKYEYSLWRPITAIREGENDGNPDTVGDVVWSSLLTTPNFPSYTSGHSTFSRAAATILANILGGDAINLSFQGDNGLIRQLLSLNDAANEAGLSRIYGGIHYSFDNIAAQQCGLDVANWVIGHDFMAIPSPGTAVMAAMGGLLLMRRRRTVR